MKQFRMVLLLTSLVVAGMLSACTEAADDASGKVQGTTSAKAAATSIASTTGTSKAYQGKPVVFQSRLGATTDWKTIGDAPQPGTCTYTVSIPDAWKMEGGTAVGDSVKMDFGPTVVLAEGQTLPDKVAPDDLAHGSPVEYNDLKTCENDRYTMAIATVKYTESDRRCSTFYISDGKKVGVLVFFYPDDAAKDDTLALIAQIVDTFQFQ